VKPLAVEILAYAPTTFFHCSHCEFVWHQAGVGQRLRADQMADNLPNDVMNDYRQLSDWIVGLVNRHGARLTVRVVDAASLEGFVKSLRYRVRRYPAVIIDGQEKLAPADLSVAEAAIERRLAPASQP